MDRSRGAGRPAGSGPVVSRREPDDRVRLDAYRVSGATGPQRPTGRWAAVVPIVVAILVLKPWGSVPGGGNGPPIIERGPQPNPSGAPTPTASTAARGEGICLDVGAWLVASVQRDRGGTIRMWQAMTPVATASGPLDPGIPELAIRSEGVLELGWCAPKEGHDAPTPEATVDAWRTDAGIAAKIPLIPPLASAETAFGAIYLPASPSPRLWSDGTYVFRHRSSDGQERWFGLILDDRPAPAA
jgi:hypothetical protein